MEFKKFNNYLLKKYKTNKKKGNDLRDKFIEQQATLQEEKGDHDLSAEEMEAITQLLTADPVSKEREELAKIKSAIKEEEEDDLEGMEE